jgi:deleted-in-malignant-brain-tumors protein 1
MHAGNYTRPKKAIQLRLVNGTSKNSGRLEIFYNGTWGTVCSEGFRYTAVAVACSMLGYK